MTYRRLPYEEASSPPDMASDCAEVGRTLPGPVPDRRVGDSAAAGTSGTVVVPDDLARLAGRMQLHLD